MKKYSFLLLLFLITSVWAECAGQNAFISGKTDADTIVVGQHFDYQLTFTMPKEYFVEWTQFDDTLSKSIEIINAGEVTSSPINNGNNVLMTQKLTLTSFDTGYVHIPEIGLTYRNSKEDSLNFTIYTNKQDIFVKTIAVDTTQAFRPIKDVMKQGVTMKETLPWLTIAIVIAALIYLFVYLTKHKKKRDVVVEKKQPKIPAIITARAKLEEMKRKEPWNNENPKTYYTDLTDIVREYIEGQFNIDAIEMTTDEIMRAIDSINIDDRMSSRLHDVLSTADFVKFAKATPTKEQSEKSFSDIGVFVEDSYIFFQEEEKKKAEKEADSDKDKKKEAI
ncbi:MAG: hypothetical protein ACI358_07960 [Candidatus Limimorpha sp.]